MISERIAPPDDAVIDTDSYKISHWKQYPPGTRHVYSYLQARGGEYDAAVVFGLQYHLLRYYVGKVVTAAMIDEAEVDMAAHFGDSSIFNGAGWRYLLGAHGGRLPLSIRCVPEGSVVPTGNVLMDVVNTDPRVPWLTNYVETKLMRVWHMMTVATQSRWMKHVLLDALERSGDPTLIDFKLHDFGSRGSTSMESAACGGAAHLVNFKGTDTLVGLRLLQRYYAGGVSGFSIPAAEHSTITSWGRHHEAAAYENMLDAFPRGLVAVVSDSYDVYKACGEIWGEQLRKKVMGRDGAIVIRPDSGNPETVLVDLLRIVGAKFGYVINSKGYRVLDPHVRFIWGDGIKKYTLAGILQAQLEAGWSADNTAYGSGGGLLQQVNRDTMEMAIKCAAIDIDGTWHDVSKEPATAPDKASRAGRLKLVRTGDRWATERVTDSPLADQLVEVFRDGVLLRPWTLDQVRERAR